MGFFQLPVPPTPPGTTVQGKTILITGGNSGMGFEAARQFLSLKASRIIITARDKTRGENAVAALRREFAPNSKNESPVIEFFDLDLDDYQSALRFCDKVKKDVPYLDVLVCNGGVSLMEYQTINSYSHFLIVLELLPLLQATSTHRQAPSRVTFTGSGAQRLTTLAPGKRPLGKTENVLAHFDSKEGFSGMTRYGDSKLLVNAFVRKLATRVSPDEVIVNNFCPGMVSSGMEKNAPLWMRCIVKVIMAIRARSVEVGSRMMVYAVAVTGKESHGKFYENNKVNPAKMFLDEDAGQDFIGRLWRDTLAELVSLDPSLKRWE
ncbi:hypothetical protein UA08_07577 [Talaromyces atroroseus]|uniref:Uncharacterized protein n=1 Tax=Talaromyces atroroseus TaxID=1441469 RepID=A0A225AG60_TALAT|nr:hypothetical protein UA08_07577 [Talaromyces atroroseus]OKL57094.1 hypothetical protein UA08_07577 [Talaromyces atroroseus]